MILWQGRSLKRTRTEQLTPADPYTSFNWIMPDSRKMTETRLSGQKIIGTVLADFGRPALDLELQHVSSRLNLSHCALISSFVSLHVLAECLLSPGVSLSFEVNLEQPEERMLRQKQSDAQGQKLPALRNDTEIQCDHTRMTQRSIMWVAVVTSFDHVIE